MQVLFKPRHPQAAELRDLTERRVRFVLRRLGRQVPRAEVQMSDVNGPCGGIDSRHLRQRPSLAKPEAERTQDSTSRPAIAPPLPRAAGAGHWPCPAVRRS